MPSVFASVSATLLILYVATLGLTYSGSFSPGLHMLWGLFVIILMILLQCLVFGFFIGSGKTIKRVVAESGLEGDWIQKTKDYKNECYPPLMLAILFTAAAGILGGGVGLGAVPQWIHEVLIWAALVLNFRSFRVSYRVLSMNVEAIHRINELVGKKRGKRVPTGARKASKGPEKTAPASLHTRYYFLAAALWVPYLYMKVSLGSRTFPLWPFLIGSVLLWGIGWWSSRKGDG